MVQWVEARSSFLECLQEFVLLRLTERLHSLLDLQIYCTSNMKDQEPNHDFLIIFFVCLFLFWGWCISEFVKMLAQGLGLS